MLKKKKNKVLLILSSLFMVTLVIIFSIFISRTHTYVDINDKLEISSYNYNAKKSIDDSYLDFDWDLENKTAAFKGIKNSASLFNKVDGDFEYDTLEIPNKILYGGTDLNYQGQTFTVTEIKKPTVSNTDMNSEAGCYTYDIIKGIIIPKSVTYIEDAAFLPFVRLEYLETPFIGNSRGISTDSNKPLGSMFSSSCHYYFMNDDETVPDVSKYNSTVAPDSYDRTISGINYSNKNSIARWYPQKMTNQVVAYLFPEKLSTLVVTDDTELPEKAFLELKTIKSITLGDTLTNLNSDECMCHCLQLEEVHLPKTATIMGDKFFSDCKSLTEVTLPDGLIETGNGIFTRCTSLATVNIPASIRKVNDQAFLTCTLLENIRVFTTNSETHEIESFINESGFALPAGIEEIHKEAFSGCRFDTISISTVSLKFIDEGAFKACNYLQTLTLPFIGYERGNHGSSEAMLGYIFGQGTVQQQYGSNTNDIYPSQIPTTLKTVNITSETYVSKGSMSNLPGVETILINPTDKNQVIEQGAFEKNASLVDLSVPYVGNNQDGNRFCAIFGTSLYTGGYQAQGYYIPTTLQKIRITNMPTIRTGAFREMTSLTDVTISNVTTYCEQAIFYGNRNLRNLTIPFAGKFRGEEYYWYSWHGNYERQNSIGWIFSTETVSDEYGLGILKYSSGDSYNRWIPNGLKSITVTDETYIGPYVFQGFKSVETITISNDGSSNVPSGISEGTMWGCSNLKNLNIPYIGANVNTSGSSGREFTIGWLFGRSAYDKAYVAYEHANYYIPEKLEKIVVLSSNKASIKVIPSYAFANLKSLTSFSTTANITTLADHAFYNDVNLNSVTTDNATYTAVGDYAFANCSKVNCIYDSADKYFVPKTVDTLGRYAFSGTAINNVDFSTTALYKLKNIGAYAFDSCSKITSINIPGVGGNQYVLQSLGEGAFANCDTLTNVNLGPNAYAKYLLKNCISVTSVDLTGVVTYVPEGMFYGCTSLSDLVLDDITTEIGRYAFYGCESLTNFDIKGTTTKIGSYAFTDCSGLDHMLMPRNVKTIEANGFYGCDRENFFFYVLDPESEWPIGWVENWNCDYPIYIYGEIDEGIFEYSYDSTLRGYEITAITKDDYFIGAVQFPSTYNGVKIVSLGHNLLKNQPRITSVVIPSSIIRIKGEVSYTGNGPLTTGALNNGNVITVFYDLPKAKALNPGKYYKDSDTKEATGANLPLLSGNENNWFNYGFVYYNDYWGYTTEGKIRVPYLKLSQFVYYLDYTEGNISYDGTAKTIEVTAVKTQAQVIDGGKIVLDNEEHTAFPSETAKITPYLPTTLFNYAYSNNVNASAQALITVTVNIEELNAFNNEVLNGSKENTLIYTDGTSKNIIVNNKLASTEKLYLGGTGLRNFAINKAQITLFPAGHEQTLIYGTPFKWNTWTNQYVDFAGINGLTVSGTLTTNKDDAGIYESDAISFVTKSLGDFMWLNGPSIKLNNVNVTDNFEIILGGDEQLIVTINPLDVTIVWQGGKWANNSTNYYTDYDNSKLNDFYLWPYTGSTIEPKATAYAAILDTNFNPSLGKEIKGITQTINSSNGYGYFVLPQVEPNYPDTVSTVSDCRSSATAYLTENKNYNLVYYDTVENKWKDVPNKEENNRKEFVVRYAVMKRDLVIKIENNSYLIGYNDDCWNNSTWPGADMTITGLNPGSYIAGDLRTYFYNDLNELQSYTDKGDYYLKQENNIKSYTNDTYNNPLKYIDWVSQIFNYDPLYDATALDYMIYRITGYDENNNPIYKCENEFYNLKLEAHINVKYNTFEPAVYIDGVLHPIKGETLIGDDTYNIIEYHTDGKPHRFTSNVLNDGIILNSSNILYSFNDAKQPGATYFEFRGLNEEGYNIGITINRMNFEESKKNYLLKVLKSDYEFAELTKEYDGTPVVPVALKKPTTDKYIDLNSVEQFYDSKAVESLASLTYTYYRCATKAEAKESNKLSSAPYEINKYVVHIEALGSDFFNACDQWIEFEITKRKIIIDLGDSSKYYDGNAYVIQYDLTNVENEKILDGHRLIGTLQTLSKDPNVYYGTGTHIDEEGNLINDVYTQYWSWKTQWKVYTLENVDVTKYYDIDVIGKFEIKKRVIYDYDSNEPLKESVESYGAPDDDYNPSNWDGLYDGLPHTITVILHNLPSTATIYYTEDEIYNAENDEGISWTKFNIQKIVPGNYIIYYKVVVPNYETYYGYEHININNQIIEYTEGEHVFEYDGNYHQFEVTVQYPLSATVEYSIDGQNWQTDLFEYRNYMDDFTPNYVRIYYRISAENFESIGFNNEKYVDFVITQDGFNELSDSDFTISGYDGFYDGNSHSISVVKNNNSIYNEKIYYSLTCLSDLSTWQLSPITISEYTTTPLKIYVRIVDAKNGSNERYKDTYGEAYSATINIKPLNFNQITISDYDGFYDGKSHGVIIDGLNNYENVDYTIYYSKDPNSEQSNSGWTTTPITFKNASTSSNIVYIKIEAPNFITYYGSGQVRITTVKLKGVIDDGNTNVTPFKIEYTSEPVAYSSIPVNTLNADNSITEGMIHDGAKTYTFYSVEKDGYYDDNDNWVDSDNYVSTGDVISRPTKLGIYCVRITYKNTNNCTGRDDSGNAITMTVIGFIEIVAKTVKVTYQKSQQYTGKALSPNFEVSTGTKDTIHLNIELISHQLTPDKVIDIDTYYYKVTINEDTDLYVLPEEFDNLIEFNITKRQVSIYINTTHIYSYNAQEDKGVNWKKDSGPNYDGWQEYMSGSLIDGHYLDLSMETSSYVRATYVYPVQQMSQNAINILSMDIKDKDDVSVLDKYDLKIQAIVKIVFESKTHNFKDKEIYYDGEEHGLVLNVDDNEIINPVITFATGDMSNMTVEEKQNADWSLYSPKYVSAGEYLINVRIQSDNLEDIYTTAKLIIKKTKLQVSVNTFDVIYDATSHEVTSKVTNITASVASAIKPKAIKYYDQASFTKAQINNAFKVSDYSKINAFFFNQGLDSCINAGNYYAVIIYEGSDDYEYGYFVEEVFIEKKDVVIELGANNIVRTKDYDGKVIYQQLTGATIHTADLITGHEAKSGIDLRKYRIKTTSSYAGTYVSNAINGSNLTRAEKNSLLDFEFHDAFLITDSDNDDADVTRNYHPVIITGITFVINKISFTFSVSDETTKVYATEESDELNADYVINGYKAVLASPNMILPSDINPTYYFDNEPIYTWYKVNDDLSIGDLLGSSDLGDRVTDVGDYYVFVTFAEGTNFEAYTNNDKYGLVHITPLTVDVDWINLEQDFTGNALYPSATYSDPFGRDIGLNVTIIDNMNPVPSVVAAGSYSTYASFTQYDGESKNYQLSQNTVNETFKINKLIFVYNVDATTYNNQTDWMIEISKDDFEDFPANLSLVGSNTQQAYLKTNGHDVGVYYYGDLYDKKLVFDYKILDNNLNDLTSSIELVASGSVIIYTEKITFEVEDIDIPYDGLYHTVLEGIKVTNPAKSDYYQITVKKITDESYTGSPSDNDYKFINVGSHKIDFRIVSTISGTEQEAKGSITITIRQIESDAIIKGTLDKEYDGLPVSESSIKVEGSYNTHQNGNLVYTYYRTDSSYSNPVLIDSAPSDVGYYIVQITNSSDSIPDSETYIKNYTDLNISKAFEIKPRKISYSYNGDQVVLNKLIANGYPIYANGFEGSILEDATWSYNPAALVDKKINLASTDELHISIQTNNNGIDLIKKLYEYSGLMPYAGDTVSAQSQYFYDDDYFSLIWWVETNGGKNVSHNYQFNFDFSLDIHYPDLDTSLHTITPSYSPSEKGMYDPSTYHYATISFDNKVVQPTNVSQSYTHIAIDSGASKSNISEMKFKDPGLYSVSYTLSADGYREYNGSYLIDIAYSTRELTDSFNAKKDTLSKVYDGTPVTIEDIVGLNGNDLKWYYNDEGIFKQGAFADNIIDNNVIIKFKKGNVETQSIVDAGNYTYTIIVPSTTYYSETIIEGHYSISRATINITDKETYYTIGYTGGYVYYSITENDPYYDITLNGSPLPSGFKFKGILQTIDSAEGTYRSSMTQIIPIGNYVITGGSANYNVILNVTMQILPGTIVATTSNQTYPYSTETSYVVVNNVTEDIFKPYIYYVKNGTNYVIASTYIKNATYYERIDGQAITRYPSITYITPGETKITQVLYAIDGTEDWTLEPIGISLPGSVTVKMKISAENFSDTILLSTITITKADAKIYIPSLTRTYNGQSVLVPQDLRIDSDATRDSANISYEVWKDNNWYDMGLNNLPVNVGRYKIIVEIPENASNLYHGVQESKEFEITKKTVAVEWYKEASDINASEKPAIEYEYDGFTHVPVAFLNTGITIDNQLYTPNYSVSVTTYADQNTVVSKPWLANIYVATVKIDDDSNWDFDADEMTYTYGIKKRIITLNILGANKVYDGNISEFSYTENTAVTPANEYYYATNMPEYEVLDNLKRDYFDEYSILQTVSKNVNNYYSNNDVSFGTDFTWKNDYQIWNLSYADGQPTEVTDCYLIEYNLSFTIGLETITWSAANLEFIYDGANHYLDFKIDNPEPATIYYWDGSGYNITSTFENGEYKLGEIRNGINSFKNVHYEDDVVSPYQVKFKIVIPNYEPVIDTRTVLIKPKPANLYLKNKVLDHEYDGYNIYDSASQVYLTTNDFDYIDSQTNPRTITLSYEKYDQNDGWIPTIDTSNVGKYKVTAVLDQGNNSNYEGGTKTYNFEVTRRTITITTLDINNNLVTKQKTYDGLSLSYSINTDKDVLNIVPNEIFEGTIKSRYAYAKIYENQEDFEWVSSYKITKNVIIGNVSTNVDVTDNYIIKYRLRFNILSAPITAKVTNLEAVKDDEGNQIYVDGNPKMGVLGSVGGDNKYSINLSVIGPVLPTIIYEYINEDTNVLEKSTKNPKFKKQGEHTVKYTVSADNYTTVTGEALVIIKGLATGGGFIDYKNVVTYNNTPYMSQTVNTKPVYISDSQGEQTITYYKADGVTPIPTPVNAGTYYFTIHVAEWEDYEEYTTSKTLFQIEKITREVEWEDYTVTYNGEDQTPKAYIYAYDNNTKLYLDVIGTYTDANVDGYDVSALFDDANPNKANYTITNFNRTKLFKIYPIEIEKPSISTSLQFIYSETYTLYDADGNPICEKDDFDKDIYNEVTEPFDSELTYYTYDDANEVYVKCDNLEAFEDGVKYYLPQFKVFRFGDEVKVKDTDGNIYIIGEDGIITGIIDSNDENNILPAPENANLYKVIVSNDRNSDEVMPDGVKHVITVSLVDDKNYAWENTNYDEFVKDDYDDSYEIPFKINRFDISNNKEGLKVEVVSEYKYYIMDIPQEITPNAEVRLVTSDGLFIRTISSGRINKYEAYLVDLDNQVLSADDYNVLGKIKAKGMSNIDFDVTGTYEKRKTPPVLFEMKDNTIRRFMEIKIDGNNSFTKSLGENEIGVTREATDSSIYLGRIHQNTKIVDILKDFKNDNSLMEVYDQNGVLVSPSQYSTKNFGTGFKIVLYSDSEHQNKIDEITGIVFGDLTGDGIINGIDALTAKNMVAGKVEFEGNEISYMAGAIKTSKGLNGVSTLYIMNLVSKSVDFNSDYQITPEELFA